jgi:hypothetical protein
MEGFHSLKKVLFSPPKTRDEKWMFRFLKIPLCFLERTRMVIGCGGRARMEYI